MIGLKFYNKYRIIVIIFTIITFFLSLYTNISDGYRFIPVLILLYFFLFVFNSRLHKYSKEYCGMFILNALMFVRYSVAIFFILINGDYWAPPYSGVIPMQSSCEIAIFYMIIELFFIFVIISLFSDKIYNKKDFNFEKKFDNSNQENKYRVVFPIVMILSILLIFVFPSSFIPDFNKFMNSSFSNDEIVITNGFVDIISYCFKIIVAFKIIDSFIKKYEKRNKFIYVVFSYLTIGLYILFSTSSSRLNMILPFVFFILITKDIFKKKGLVLLLISFVILIYSIMTITVYKNSWLFSNGSNIKTFTRVLSSQIQEYTSNIRPIAQGIEATSVYKQSYTVTTFINDFVGSIPVLNHYTNPRNRSNVYYNAYILNNNGKTTPLIMPLVCISSIFFSPAFCWLLTCMCILIMMFIDRNKKYDHYNDFLEKYINIYLVFIFAACIYCNSQIIVGRLITKALPVYILYFLNKKILVVRK